MSDDRSKIQGEGDRESARKYNEDTERFAKSGKVDEAAKEAASVSEEQKQDIRKAEEEAKQHSKEDDPQLKRDYDKPTH
ncbi:hypothetical protein HUS23_09210 [Ectothiorhodospiraceae bacterium 2226]|nr:hypothetical protein HUS23_09210 [Ectothiorhodospiraceae bacterium 2226]